MSLAENTDYLFVGKTLLHGVVLMLLMKTLLTSSCVNQRGAGQFYMEPSPAGMLLWLSYLHSAYLF
ncbi:hypothetical protein BFG07_11600 [Kosakonia cowanii]|nr:hypothetical protein BFG07_11600 [Kosakonia cowanii]